MFSTEDHEMRLLVQCSEDLQKDYTDKETIWEESPFKWIQMESSGTKGAIGKRLISSYLSRKGFNVSDSPGHESDRVIADKRAAIKTSYLWGGGEYKFQQIRDQDYDFVLCLGISPFDVHCWIIPKQVIIDKWDSGEIPSQHLGDEGKDTAWLTVNPRTPPEWIREWGGSLTEAVAKITEITGQKPLPQ